MAKRVEGNPYENLANGIIVQACDDYRAELKKIKKNPWNRDSVDETMRIERFFHSRWFSTLTAVDGDFLILKIREEATA